MPSKIHLFNGSTALHAGLIYATGDSVAAWILGEFQLQRMLGILLLGATLYAIEIPAYFRWLQHRFDRVGFDNTIKKAILAQAFFNPLWIARHLAFIKLFSGDWSAINRHLLTTSMESFLHLVPIGLVMNYLIHNRVPLNWRFLASALYSALTAIYLAFSEVLFG